MQEYRDMMTEIEKQGSLGPVLKQIETAVAGTSREIMEKGKNKKIFFLGCGDSYFAGSAGKRGICGGNHQFPDRTSL